MYKRIKFNLFVFKDYKFQIYNNIFINLFKLYSQYDNSQVYDSKDRNTFYCERSHILGPYSYFYKSDKLFIERLKKYSINYVENSGFLSSENSFIEFVKGFKTYTRVIKTLS